MEGRGAAFYFILFYFLSKIINIPCEVKSASACAHTKREEEEEGKKENRREPAQRVTFTCRGCSAELFSRLAKGAELVLFARMPKPGSGQRLPSFLHFIWKTLLPPPSPLLLSWPFSRHSADPPSFLFRFVPPTPFIRNACSRRAR